MLSKGLTAGKPAVNMRADRLDEVEIVAPKKAPGQESVRLVKVNGKDPKLATSVGGGLLDLHRRGPYSIA